MARTLHPVKLLPEADVALRDGSTVHVRPVRPEDQPAMRAFLSGLSEDSRWLRFFSAGANLDVAARWATEADGDQRAGLVATTGPDGRIVGHAGWQRDRERPERAEVGLVVADELQGRGLGTLLLGQLAQAAQAAGVTLFTAEVLPENRRMIQVFRDSGLPVRLRSEPGLIHVEVPASLTPQALERFERREQVAAVAALRQVLSPRSVAVIGASRQRGTVGGELFHNLLAGEFNGPVYPVNPSASVVQSVVAYRSVLDVPGPVDLAVVATPAAAVVGVARECAAKGVRALVVISAGFAETGPEGLERQRALLRTCREAGMRLIGPNCLGVINTDPRVRLHATFGPVAPTRGRVGFLSQSGALGLAIIELANTLGLGLSSFVSVGNKADISGNDLLAYWAEDPGTDLILLYLESFGNPRRFARLARQVARRKPIVAVKSGRSVAGARATSSHTGALLAAADVTVDALFQQAGVIRTDTLAELFDVATLLANQPVPAGRRVGIVTNAGGPGILCADACEASGLTVPALSEGLRAELASFLPAEAALGNPVDLLASAPAEHYRQAVERIARSGEVDALVAIFIPPLATQAAEVARALREASKAVPEGVPLLAVFMGSSGMPPELRGGERAIPSYAFPEDAARALAHAARYGAWRAAPEGRVRDFPRDADQAAAILATALSSGPRWLTPDEVTRLLSCYGLPLVASKQVRTPEEAGRAAAELGGPVALKAVAPGLVHKTEAGAVRLGLDPGEVTGAAREMARAVTAAGHQVTGFVVQRMAGPGVEMLVGVVSDPSFGPVVACGAGGVTTELLKDAAVRIAPLTDADAREMVRELATFPLLEGYRGAPRADVAALEEVILRVSTMVDERPEIAELDCNPVIVGPDGAVIVDARVRVEQPAPPQPLSARRNP